MRIERGFDNLEKVGAVWADGSAHGGAAGALTWASGLVKMSNEHARAFQAHHRRAAKKLKGVGTLEEGNKLENW